MPPQHAEVHGALSAASVFKVHESTGDASVTVPAGARAEVNADLARGALTAHDASLHVSRGASAEGVAEQHVDGDLASATTISVDGEDVLVAAGTRLDASGVVENGTYRIQDLHLSRAGISDSAGEAAPVRASTATEAREQSSELHGTLPAGVSFAVYGSVYGGVNDQTGTSLTVRIPEGARTDAHLAPISGTLAASEIHFQAASTPAPTSGARVTLHGSLAGSITVTVAGTPVVLPAGAHLRASGTLINGTFVAREVQVNAIAPASGTTPARAGTSVAGSMVLKATTRATSAPKTEAVATTTGSASSNGSRPASPAVTASTSVSARPSVGTSASKPATVTGTATTTPSSHLHLRAATQAAPTAPTTTSAATAVRTQVSVATAPSTSTSTTAAASVTAGTTLPVPSAALAASSSTPVAAPSTSVQLTSAPSSLQAAAYPAGTVLPKTGRSPTQLVLGLLLVAAGLGVRPWVHHPSDR